MKLIYLLSGLFLVGIGGSILSRFFLIPMFGRGLAGLLVCLLTSLCLGIVVGHHLYLATRDM